MLNYNKALYGQAEEEAVLRSLRSGWLSGWKETIKFEEELAQWWGVKYAISTNSGSVANFIAIQSLDLPKKGFVITPAGAAFPTTIAPLIYLGLRPYFVDISLDNWCIDLNKLNHVYYSQAIFFSHTLGFMPDMEKIVNYAKQYDLILIEDCCDAMGSKQNGKKAGTFGDLATVSFYPAHHMTTGGEGGAILTNNYQLYLKCRSIRDWGRACYCRAGYPSPACKNRFENPPFDHRYFYTNIGLNSKMTEMQAAFGREQLKKVDGFIKKRQANYTLLAKLLGIAPQCEISPFAMPLLSRKKEKVTKYLFDKGIETRTIFSGNILKHPAYKNIDCEIANGLKNSDRVFNEGFFVGIGPHLTTENIKYIAKCLKEIL